MLRLMTLVLCMGALTGTLTACSNPVEDLKSPCVGAEKSPCDKRSPAEQYS